MTQSTFVVFKQVGKLFEGHSPTREGTPAPVQSGDLNALWKQDVPGWPKSRTGAVVLAQRRVSHRTSSSGLLSHYRIAGPFTWMPLIIIFSSSTFGLTSNAVARLMNSFITKP